MANKLTVKQQLFIEAFLGQAKANATEAARIAGYACPRQQGERLLRNVEIASRVRARVAELAATADDVLRELGRIGFAPWKECLQIEYDKDGNVVGAWLDLKDKIRALELLGRYYKLFTDKHQIESLDGSAMPTLHLTLTTG